MITGFDEQVMQKAINIAVEGLYTTRSNPMVGCIIIDKKTAASQSPLEKENYGAGYHLRPGELHAEQNAILDAQKKGIELKGASVYITLEPCCHYGNTPPCTDKLIQIGAERVIIGTLDQTPELHGKGVKVLKSYGIEVEYGCLEKSCYDLNPGFNKRQKTGLPYVRCKSAMSLDGKTAMASGYSKWITGSKARLDVQHLRARSSAILSGINTVLMDDPALTVRQNEWENPCEVFIEPPLRVILDSKLKIPADARLFQKPGSILLVTNDSNWDQARVKELYEANQHHQADLSIISLPGDKGKITLDRLLVELGKYQINDLMVESGGYLIGQFIQQALVDELWIYMAPVIMGHKAKPLYKLNIDDMAQRYRLTFSDIERIGSDIRLIGRHIIPSSEYLNEIT